MPITNPKRKKRIEKFIDKDHRVMNDYYELIESDISAKKLEKELKEMIEADPDFYDPYIALADLYFYNNKKDAGGKLLKIAYDRAVDRIVDSRGNWPELMEWGWLENRHLMRALEQFGVLLWETGKTKGALDIFRKILRMNPGDNQGMRHNILAIRLGMGVEEWQKPFEAKHKGEVVGIDAGKVSNWFEKNAKNFPDEFDWLFEEWKKFDEQ
ncbi:MAG: tetratricopeptide repeat protein [Candidatus Moranbacteria bacterium]|nr:tetratricopeptide repeat protein [Candidatus Moranbacteria bacterium]